MYKCKYNFLEDPFPVLIDMSIDGTKILPEGKSPGIS
jgi:hypothetical protein